jgi:hypothetical protein
MPSQLRECHQGGSGGVGHKLSQRYLGSASGCRGQGIHQGRYALVLILVGGFVVLTVGASVDGLWLNQAAAVHGGEGSTVPIPPPDPPPPQVTDGAPSETSTSPVGTIVPAPTETTAQESGSGPSTALWVGVGLGIVGLLGLAVGVFILMSSQRARNDA